MSSPLTAEYSCSRLSPHLSFGTISIKYIIKKITKISNENNVEKIQLIPSKKISLALSFYSETI